MSGHNKIIDKDDPEQIAKVSANRLWTGLFDSNGNQLIVDPITGALPTLAYEHHEVHEGNHFFCRSYNAIAKGTLKEFLIITPDTTKWDHFLYQLLNNTGGLVISMFEAPTVSDNGALKTCFNRNRNSTTSPTMLLYEDPTIDVDGILIFDFFLGTGKGTPGIEIRDNEEIVLKRNTMYLFRLQEQDLEDTIVSWTYDWYEHTNKV